MREWQRRRGRLNHDWLKNQLSPVLGKWLNVISGEVEDEGFAERLRRSALAEWPEKRHEIAALLDDFLCEMSPRTLFLEPPLSGCDNETKKWLGELVHQRWVETSETQALLSEAMYCLEQADLAYGALVSEGSLATPHFEEVKLELLLTAAVRFRKACEALGRALSKFPSEVTTA
ncbi:MAG TPA: hypothetical protein VF173_09250 [Thermoanaerobaculia bacterium]|nr:hypothetical protein [Thermoanaerobaculia bacterium]